MNNITELLDLEDSDITISDIIVEGHKNYFLETPPSTRYCPTCSFHMHSRGIKNRTTNHPILQDGYSLSLILSNVDDVVLTLIVCIAQTKLFILLISVVESPMQQIFLLSMLTEFS